MIAYSSLLCWVGGRDMAGVTLSRDKEYLASRRGLDAVKGMSWRGAQERAAPIESLAVHR